MERERSMSSSSSDSWSLLEEIEDENENDQQSNEEEADSVPPIQNVSHKIGQMDGLESISSVQLPLDISAALLAASPQHLLVVTTPASSSIVTQTGAILSPEQSAQALANDPNSPVLVSPPKTPPIESSFTFLKDPKLRISFSDSCESREEDNDHMAKGGEEEGGQEDNAGIEENATDDEVFEQNTNPVEPTEKVAINEESTKIVENLAKEITEMVDIEMQKVEDEFEREKVVIMAKEEESAKMSMMMEISKKIKIADEYEECSEPESILSCPTDCTESISSHPEYSSSSENSTLDSSCSEIEEAGEDEEKLDEENMQIGMAQNEEKHMEEKIECGGTMSTTPSSSMLMTTCSSFAASLVDAILPSLPQSIPSSQENHSEREEIMEIGSNGGELVEGGWTELSVSSISSYSTDEANLVENFKLECGGINQGQNEEHFGSMDPVELVAKRFDELSDQLNESLWQRLLDETFGSLKNFERSDRIINILIIAMFLTSISSMTILHILENTWMGNNISTSIYSSRRLAQIPEQSSMQPIAEFRADFRQEDDKWNSELRQCKDKLLEAKHAYESKAKLLHYVRFKEMEQEALVDELRKELDATKLALDNFEQKQKSMALSSNPIFYLDEETNEDGKIVQFDENGLKAFERRIRKRKAQRSALERAKHGGPNVELSNRPEEYADEESGMPTKPTALLTPMIWPGMAQMGQLIGPPAMLNSHLVPPPVVTNFRQKQTFEDKAIDVQEDLNQYWPSQFGQNTFDNAQASTISGHPNENSEEENDGPECSQPKRAKMEEEEGKENGFGQMLPNWRKYNEIIQNLSTHSGRSHMLRSVKNAVVARLNRTIEKTTTALAAATKLVTSENFGHNLFSSTVREVMARMENSGISHIVDCLNNGLQRIQNIQLCIPQFVDWPIGDEEDEEEEEYDEDDDKKEEYGIIDEKEEENENQASSSSQNVKEEEILGNGAKIVDVEEKEEEDGMKKEKVEEDHHAALTKEERNSESGGWLLQRATARAALRHRTMDHGSLLFLNSSGKAGTAARFSRWLFARAALRQKQRKEQQNETVENEIRSSLFRDNWMFARQKIRAKLRGKQHQSAENGGKENWFFVRQKMREKAREKEAAEDENEEELSIGGGNNNWLWGRQKLRRKFREEETMDSSEEEVPTKGLWGKKRKWWRKQQQKKKKWKKGWTTNYEQEEEEFYGDSSQFSGDEEED